MAHPRKRAPDGTAAPNIHRDASRVFARRPGSEHGPLTHETLAADLAAFHRDGGTIEVLGTTYTRRKVGQDGKPLPPAGALAGKRRR
jgi:hypothetical protein